MMKHGTWALVKDVLREQFSKYDAQGSGNVSMEDFCIIAKEMLPKVAAKTSEIEFQQKMYDVLDNCGALTSDSRVDYNIFIDFLALSETMPKGTAAGQPSNQEAATSEEVEELQEGDVIQARYGGKEDWYDGKISTVCGGGAYNVLYSDGDNEYGVMRSMIRKVELFPVGTKVEVRYGGNTNDQWYNGRIECLCGGGLYDVMYDDGDKEKGVKMEYIRAGKVDEPLCLHPVLKDMTFTGQIRLADSENQPGCMGRFLLHYDTCNNKPCYKQAGGKNHMYFVSADNSWNISDTLGSTDVSLYASQDVTDPMQITLLSWKEGSPGGWIDSKTTMEAMN